MTIFGISVRRGSKLGIAIWRVDEAAHYPEAGDAHERFSIQSISKVLGLAVVAMRHYPEEDLAARPEKILPARRSIRWFDLGMGAGIRVIHLLMCGRAGGIRYVAGRRRASAECWKLCARSVAYRICV